nr:hypothetical protein [Tanacetum cinerariifolium]
MDDDQDEEVGEWLMAPVTPPRVTVTVPSTYEVGSPSTTTPVGHPLITMASGVATQPQELKEPIEDQPLPADASPTTLSPGYIVDSDPEKDEKDPKEDPAYYHADRGNNDDDELSN